MRGSRRRHVSLAMAFAIGAIVLATAAWACTPQPLVLSASPMAAAPGEVIQVSGTGVPFAATVQIRLDGDNGPVLAQASPDSQGNFSTSLTVPEVASGIYTLTLSTPGGGSAGRIAVEVIGGGAPEGGSRKTGDLWSGFSNSESVGYPSLHAEAATDSLPGNSTAGWGLVVSGAGLLAAAAALITGRRPGRRNS